MNVMPQKTIEKNEYLLCIKYKFKNKNEKYPCKAKKICRERANFEHVRKQL